MKQRFFLLSIFLFLVFYQYGQYSTVLLTTGKVHVIKDFTYSADREGDSVLIYVNKNGREKEKYFDEVFSVRDKNGKTKILYKPLSDYNDSFTLSQMESYVNGRFDGWATKISPMVAISAGIIGFGSAFIPDLSFSPGDAEYNMNIDVIVPIAQASIMGGFSTPDRVLKDKFPNKLNDEYYILGVDDSMRRKRVKSSLIAGIIGLAAGTITYYAIQ